MLVRSFCTVRRDEELVRELLVGASARDHSQDVRPVARAHWLYNQQPPETQKTTPDSK